MLPQTKKNINNLQLHEQTAVRMISAGALALCREAEEWGLFGLEKTRLHGDLTAAPQHLWEITKTMEPGFL